MPGGVQSGDGQLTEVNADGEQTQSSVQTQETEKALQCYRPPVQKPPQPARASVGAEGQEKKRTAPSEVSLEIRVRLTFDRLGVCDIALLAERTSELDDEVVVKFGGISLLLVGQEDWYQDFRVGEYRWSLAARDLN